MKEKIQTSPNMGADTFLDRIIIRVNSHDYGVPNIASVKALIDWAWEQNFGNWVLKATDEVHYEVIDFSFTHKTDTLTIKGWKTIRDKINEAANKILNKIGSDGGLV